MRDQRGLSAVVATLIIILLVLVAVGIIWVVVRNIVQTGTEEIDYATKCIAVDLTAVGVTPVTDEAANYSVTLSRGSGGDDIDGVKVTVFNATTNSGVLDFGASMVELDTTTQKIANTNITNADKIEFTAYFVDTSGNNYYCDTATYEF